MDRGGPEHRLLAKRLCGIADVLTLDARGHGDSGGTFTYGVREPEDLAALARSLRPEYDRLGGLGFSYGGFHTIVAAARDGVFDAVAVVGTPHHLFIFDQNFLTAGLARSLPLLLRRRRRSDAPGPVAPWHPRRALATSSAGSPPGRCSSPTAPTTG